MQQAMAPPEGYGSPAYDSYRRQEQLHHQGHNNGSYTPSRHVGYREDYSRAQHATLEQEQHHSIARASSDVGPTVSQEQLRFSAHVNRFASHDPRFAPVHTNKSVSVSERIKRFNATELRDSDMRQQAPPSPQRHQQTRYYSTHSKGRHPSRERSEQAAPPPPPPEQAPVRPSPSRVNPQSSYRRHQEMAQDHYHADSRERRQQESSPATTSSYSRSTPTGQPSAQRSLSRERERRSRSPAARTTEQSPMRSIERDQRSRSPAARLSTESNLGGSPSRSSETQRAARSLLQKRRQRRLEQEAQNAVEEQNQPSSQDRNRTNEREARRQSLSERRGEVKKVPSREEGRTDRILREARSRSMSPRVSRYSRKAYGIPPPSSPLLNGKTEMPARASDYGGTSKRRSHAWDKNTVPKKEGGSSKKYPSSPQIAVREQELVSPMTPGSANANTPSSNAHAPPSPTRSQNTSGSNTSSVQELKRQLWDNNETLQVAVKPSLSAHGYSDRRTKQTSGYYAPEMAGRHGQRVRSLSPNPRQQIHGHERPAIPIEPQKKPTKFNSKFVQAALSSQRDGRTSPVLEEMPRSRSSSPKFHTPYPTSTAYRHPHHNDDQMLRRSESPRPPITPGRGSPLRSSFDEEVSSPRTGSSTPRTGTPPVPDSASHSIERVLSSAGASSATGEASVAKLVAKLTSVSREDPEKALRMIDSILKAESRSSSGGPGSRAGSRAGTGSGDAISPVAVASPDENGAPEDDDEESESSDTSCDDTSVSSITNPTYQRDDKAYTPRHGVSTTSGNPRPSSLNKYSQLQPTSPQEGSRGNSSKAKKEKKPPPPATIKVNKSDSGNSKADSNKLSSMKGNGSREMSSRKVRALSPPATNRNTSLGNNAMDPAAIAMKIRGWDEQLDSYEFDAAPLSPTRTEDTGVTAATEDLGSIITPQSPKETPVPENRRAHPWDVDRAQITTKPMAIDLTVTTGTNNSVFDGKEEGILEPVSPWQRRRVAKEMDDPSRDKARRDFDEENTGRRHRASTNESPRIAPNVYDVHRNRRRRSRSREGSNADKSRSLLDQNVERSAQPSSANPFDSGYENTPRSTRSGTRNPFDSDNENRPSTTRSDTGNPFDLDYKSRPNSTRSDTGDPFVLEYNRRFSGTKSDTGVFDSAWGAIPTHAFSDEATSRGRARSSASPTQVDLPPRTPAHRLPYGTEEAPEASLDPNESGGGRRRRRSLLKMKRSTTPKKDRQPQQPTGSKPLLSPYAMDSVEDATMDIRDEFKLPSKSPGRNARSRTLSPAPRKVKKSKSPGRNRLRMNRNDSFTDGEDESSSLTGSLTGSTTSSVRNKNLARKFSRFLKVYED